MPAMTSRTHVFCWIARAAVLIVLCWNLDCALSFLLQPEGYLSAYELNGASGIAAIQGIAVAFLMWNATYPLVIISPLRFKALYAVVVAQQIIGLIGESCILASLDATHATLAASLTRFIAFDAAGLVIMALAFVALLLSARRKVSPSPKAP